MRIFISSLFLALCTMLTACTKHAAPKDSTYTFTNTVPERITVDVYNSEADYVNNANRAGRYNVDAGSDVKITLPAPGTVWLDWYSSGFTYNNWRRYGTGGGGGSNGSKYLAETPVAIVDDHVYLESAWNYGDTSRSVILNGDGTSSTWEMDVPPAFGPLTGGHYKFTFRKDFTGEYLFNSVDGSSKLYAFSYFAQQNGGSSAFNNTSTFTLYLSTPQVSNNWQMSNVSLSSFSASNRDTMHAYSNMTGGSFAIVRK